MSPHQLLSVVVRLFVLWLAIYAGRTALGFFVQMKPRDDSFALIFSAALLLVAVALGSMWFFSRTLARMLLPGGDKSQKNTFAPDDWFDVGCSLLGLWVLTNAVPGIVRYLIILYLDKRDPATFPLSADWHAAAIYSFLELCVGLWLLLGAAGIKRLIQHVRYAGPR